MEKEAIEVIKETGYWRVLCYPLEYEPDLIPDLANLRKLITNNVVSWRGSDFPNFNEKEVENGQNYISTTLLFGSFREFTKLYLSGQFIHLQALHEDFIREAFGAPTAQILPPNETRRMDFISLLYSVTEMMEFIKRLSNSEVSGRSLSHSGMHVEIGLHGTKNRVLGSLYNQGIFLHPYTCTIPEITYTQSFSAQRMASYDFELSLEVASFFYQRFGWMNANIAILREQQRKLIERRF